MLREGTPTALATSALGSRGLVGREPSGSDGSFGLFIRSLVGLDREAAKPALAEFLEEDRSGKNQTSFVKRIINYLTEHGTVEPRRVHESRFTAVA